jgi:hypothetical protein
MTTSAQHASEAHLMTREITEPVSTLRGISMSVRR